MIRPMRSNCFLLLVAGLLACPACTSTAPRRAPDGLIGPLVGFVSTDSATIWMHGGPEAEFRVEIRESMPGDGPANDADVQWRSETFRADPDAGDAATVTLTGLRPDTRYRYRIEPLHDPDARPAWDATGPSWMTGAFRTPPTATTPTRFTVAVASCIKTRPSRQGAWARLRETDPSLLLLLGDNAYIESTRTDYIWAGHLSVRAMPEFADVIRNVPTCAIWDDHDYANDNASGRARGKERSLAAFKGLWPNLAHGTDDLPGVFHTFSWGPVDFFMLDVRYHRSPRLAPDDDRKRMLGDAQYEWLEDALLHSTAPFKIIATGSTLRESGIDGWRLYDFSRKRLYRLIDRVGVDGVLVLSGDVHYSAVRTHTPKELGGRELTEVISSGIANSRELSFAALTFDTTDPSDPHVTIRIIDADGTLLDERTVR